MGVITSYSIHYTKLYDSGVGRRGVPDIGGGLWAAAAAAAGDVAGLETLEYKPIIASRYLLLAPLSYNFV